MIRWLFILCLFSILDQSALVMKLLFLVVNQMMLVVVVVVVIVVVHGISEAKFEMSKW